jgi:hypothetical protein
MIHFRKIATAGWLISALLLSRCTTVNQEQASNTEFGNVPAELADSLKLIGQRIQRIEVDPTKDNVVKGNSGTILYISSNSLLDEKGTPVASTVVIEIKEHYTFADFIASNLQTVHNNDILQTQGMIYVSAQTADGSAVKIDPSKPIRIEFPVQEKVLEAKIFKGYRDAEGQMNWNEMIEPSKLLIPFPIRSLFGDEMKMTGDSSFTESSSPPEDLLKFENTLLATREFRDRYRVYRESWVPEIYMTNLEKNLWEIDELTLTQLRQDSTQMANETVAKEYLQFYADHLLDISRKIRLFRKFAAEKLTKIDTTKKVDDTTLAEINTPFVTFEALDFGWVNVDYFYNDPKAEKVKLIAKTNEKAHTINLIIPSRNVILSGTRKDDNTYFFTKNEDGYNKLPKGEKAIVLSLSMAPDNTLLFAEKEIFIGQNETETLKLRPATGKSIKTQLAKYNP